MATGTSFKQQCPSCEAAVAVKDVGMVGKKIECPKCKDKFVVKSPSKKKAVEDDEEVDSKGNGKASAKAKPAPKKRVRDDDVDDEDDVEEVDEVDEEELKKLAAKGKKKKPSDEDEDDEDDKGKGKKKKKAGGNRMVIVLAVISLLVLGLVGFFILGGKGGTPSKPSKSSPMASSPAPVPDTSAVETKKEVVGTDKPADVKPAQAVLPLSAANAELTNLLPNDTDHVAHIPFRVLFDLASPLRDALFQTPDALKDDYLKTKIGFSVLAVDDMLRADHYGVDGWSFTVVHLQEIIDQEAVKKALDLKPAPAIKKYTHYQVSSPNPWFEALARVAIGVPRPLRVFPQRDNRALYVHFHNPQTLIFADEIPMVAFLKEDKRFRTLSDSPTPPPTTTDPNQPATSADTPMPMQPPMPMQQTPMAMKTPMLKTPMPMQTPMPMPGSTSPSPATPDDKASAAPVAPPRLETYMTIRPELKATLDRMETPSPESQDKILFSSATDLNAARLPAALASGSFLWYPRQLWDVTHLVRDRNPRLRTLGVALVQKDLRIFRLRNDFECPVENDAKNFEKDLVEDIAVDVARFIDRFLAHKVEVPAREETLPPINPNSPNAPAPPPPQPPPMTSADSGKALIKPKKEELPTASKITVNQKEKTVEFLLDLKLEPSDFGKLHAMAQLMACGVRAEMEVGSGLISRHELARAGKLLPEKGLSERSVLPGNYPPGAFPRPFNNAKRFMREPINRVSWMAGLLPYLGHNTLYQKINFNDSWRDPTNWIPASTLVSEFLDPSYPTSSHYLTLPGLPFEVAATHYVGIAGVGLDAADYDSADPAYITKRGVMSYDKGLPLEEVRQGHGLGNTILMLEVPHDNLVGVNPWMAGGGSTLRGVPEKNSVAPFIPSGTRKDGRPRGTYALMADGSVRYIDQNVADEVFKAMATAKRPLPDGFDPDASDSKTDLVKPPKGFDSKKPAPAVPKAPPAPVQKAPEPKVSPSLPPGSGWTPDPALVSLLKVPGDAAGYRLNLPADYEPIDTPAPPIPGGKIKIVSWRSKITKIGDVPALVAVTVFNDPQALKEATANMQQMLVSFATGVTTTAGIKVAAREKPETGVLDGITFTRFRWSGTKDANAARGTVYGGIDNGRVITIALVSFGVKAESESKLLESAIATLKRQ